MRDTVGRRIAAATLALAAFVGAAARAELPSEWRDAVPRLLKVLAYDVNFDARGTGEFVVLVASEAAQEARREEVLAVLRGLPTVKIKSRPVKFVGGQYQDEATLQERIDESRAAALLAVPGLTEAGLHALSEVAQDNQLYTLALDRAMVERALAVGIELTGGRPQVVINEKASREIGAKFETAVLRQARVIQ